MELMEKERPGYKKTELGSIPDDWEIIHIENEIDLLTGFPFASEKYSNSGIRLLRGSNVKRNCTDWNEGITQYWTKVTPDLKKYFLKEGDIVIAMDGSLVGKSFAQLQEEDLPSLLLQRVARIRSEKIDINYLKEWICSKYFTVHCEKVKTSSAIPHISPKDIRDFQILVPPTLEEQKAIAATLSDTDALIAGLDKIIAKKKAIIQGAMQQLLIPPNKGGKRLPGFYGEWEEKRLGEIGNTYGGLTGKNKADFDNGIYNYITFLNVMNNVVIDDSIFEKVYINLGESQNEAKKGDLFFNTSSETPEEVGMCAVLLQETSNLYLNSFCFGYRLKHLNEIDPLFISYLINSSTGRQLFLSLAQGATRYNLSKSNFNEIVIEIPQNKLEQLEIVKILSDMDKEIEVLKSKKVKFEQMKQGMMQELLTGKTRLV